MTSNYNTYPTPSPSTGQGSTLDLLDSFMSSQSQRKEVRFAVPPDAQSVSSYDSSSVDEESQDISRQTQQLTTALVPYYAQQQPQPPVQQQSWALVPAAPSNNTTALTVPIHKLIRVPRSDNPFGADAIHPKKKSMKKQRKRKTAAGAVGGMVVGGLTLGPAGVFLGAAAGAVATNKICKARERRAQRKYEQESFQRAAERSNVHLATFA